ncbi:hypothetical protein D3C72_2108850 [compost metagenome]
MREPPRSIMPGWVWANSKARGAWIDTRKVWALTEYAHSRELLPAASDSATIRARSPTDLRIYGFLQNQKSALADFRKSVKA